MEDLEKVKKYQEKGQVALEEKSENIQENKEIGPGSFDQINQEHSFAESFWKDIDLQLGHLVEEAETPEARQEISNLRSRGELIARETLKKISGQLGSIRGGWYEDQETKNRYYIKFYENPDQARVEFIANAIYEKLGINAADSQLLEIEGQLVIASREVAGAQSVYREDQKKSSDVRDGFVADAYLANWDVAGLNYDNIVRGGDGRMHRIDNGGSLVFRAQGGSKEYVCNKIPELQNMLNPEYSSGQVFQGMTEQEIAKQARTLLEKLQPSDIEDIVNRAGVTGSLAEELKAGLIGRRQFLYERFGSQETSVETERIAVLINKLFEESESLKETFFYPRVGLLADKETIENQQVDIIYDSQRQKYNVNFKLTADNYEAIRKKIAILVEKGDIQVEAGGISYFDNLEGEGHFLVRAQKIDFNGLIVKISTGMNEYDREVRSALGLVRIEVPADKGLGEKEISDRINRIFRDLLGIEEGLEPPDAEAEKRYKRARYLWHHKLAGQLPDEQEIERKLTREEVFPGYWTIVEKGKHREYQDISPYAIFHNAIGGVEAVIRTIRAGGLFSTHERYRRGCLLKGKSSDVDLETGGADSVFTRIVTEAGLAKNKKLGVDTRIWESIYFVFEPDLLDRTDWYSYYYDRFGSTDPVKFQDREVPEELFENQEKEGFNPGNEQMFRLGIPVEKIKAIAVRERNIRSRLLEELYRAGISEINGESIYQFVVNVESYDDFFDITQGKKPRSQAEETF